MKSLIILSFLFGITFNSIAQESSIKRELDSLKTVHAVCDITSQIGKNIKTHDSLSKIQEKYKSQYLDIQSFKIGRTKLDKEKQIKEINTLIENNDKAIIENRALYHSLLEKLKVAEEKVKLLN
ncbi:MULTISPECIES: hypothetical protein [Meridianimaribacter]|uniref:Uncharacterized protein n=1 Tax=Meridianimaribacter flavus TaxID=571115 RepID=A0ABY2G703_9FLAO|nr:MULTISPECIES: hypothetical protein [Meridianimaribacter]TBV26624.1 hypothetical protein DMZ43_06055 [Meridianimaribacter sp. CL38]TDY12309.1 hypothetical protein A8975_1072 [Meridianimaribacter flavus]